MTAMTAVSRGPRLKCLPFPTLWGTRIIFMRLSGSDDDYMALTASQRIGNYVRELTVKHLASPSDFRVPSQVFDVWRECVGDALARHVRPVIYRQGRLVLHAEASAWATRVQQQRASVCAHLRAYPLLAGLRELHVRVVPTQSAITPPAPFSGAPLSAGAARCLADLAAHTDHPALKEALRRLAARGPSR